MPDSEHDMHFCTSAYLIQKNVSFTQIITWFDKDFV